jgi:hypothetical protein
MNSDLYKFNCSLHCFAYFDGDPEVNVTKEIVLSKKNNGIQPLGITKIEC